MVLILPALEGMAVMAQGSIVRNLIVVSVAVNMVNRQLALMLGYKVTLFTVVLFVEVPRTLDVGLGD